MKGIASFCDQREGYLIIVRSGQCSLMSGSLLISAMISPQNVILELFQPKCLFCTMTMSSSSFELDYVDQRDAEVDCLWSLLATWSMSAKCKI